MAETSEKSFETVIEFHLLANGYVHVAPEGIDRERAIFPEEVLAFIRKTQPQEWAKLEALHGERTGEQVLGDLCKWMDAHGSLTTLRHGFKCYGRTLRVAFFKAAHELNPELEERYAANRLGITRQLHFSARSEKSLDVTLSLNGIPIATAELKNPLTGQTTDNAKHQYRQDRDPRELLFEFKRRTLVHFAVDTEAVLMTTRLAGTATHFLPFNRGRDGGAGNPSDPEGRTYRTAYLWEEVLRRDSLLDLLARFLHLQIEEKRTEEGRKVRKETMIFPRYHQLQAVRSLVDAARSEGVGYNYLIEHSAGSGKSNTIGWLAHRLSSLHDVGNQRVFDSVIVITDRVVLDQQLQDTIYQFEHKRGVVQKIDESSRQLAEALENAVPIIITTLQKFPFVSRQLLKMAEERGENGTGTLSTRRCAVIIDEAHSSQGGETATDLKEVLGGETTGRRGRPGRHGGTLPQHGQTRPAGQPEFLRLHGYAQAQDLGGLRAKRRSLPPLHHATGHRGGVHPRCAEALHDLRDLFQTAQGLRGRSERGAEKGRAGPGAFSETPPAQHRSEDRDHGRAFSGGDPPQNRRPGQGHGRNRFAPGGGPLQTELRSLH
jgi:type I restriction enzyme R subunit